MSFKGVDVMDVKYEFVLKSLDDRLVFTDLCREYGISTKCGYKWRQRFLEEGYAGLEEQSRKPQSNSRSIPEPVSVEIVRIKKLHPAWGQKRYWQYTKGTMPGNTLPRAAALRIFLRAPDIPE